MRAAPGAIDIATYRTTGDRQQTGSLSAIGGKGLFTLELEDALRSGKVDAAVHSLKDLPTEDAPSLVVGAIPKRADPRSIYLCTDEQSFFPDDTTHRMGKALGLSSKYYVSVLQRRIDIEGQEVLLTGIEPIARKDESAEKRNMVLPGTYCLRITCINRGYK